MIRIRPEQVDVLELGIMADFEDLAVGHLREHFAPEIEAMDEATLRRFIGSAVERARAHGAEDAIGYGLYLDVMVMFGEGFEDDPALPWAKKILADTADRPGNVRMKYLAYCAAQHLRAREGGEAQA